MVFALVLILSAPSRAMSMKHDFHMEQLRPVVRVSQDVLEAAGGDADCVVYQEIERHAEPTDPIIVRCPDTLGSSVLEAARKWKLTVDHGRLHVFEIIMVRAEAKTTTETEAPPIPPTREDVTRPRFVPTITSAPAYPEAARQLLRELKSDPTLGGRHSTLVANCQIKLSVDAQGVPFYADESLCPQVFREAAKVSLFRWRFQPLRLNGESVKRFFTVNLRFVE